MGDLIFSVALRGCGSENVVDNPLFHRENCVKPVTFKGVILRSLPAETASLSYSTSPTILFSQPIVYLKVLHTLANATEPKNSSRAGSKSEIIQSA